jgi:hypothetical protein
MGPGAIRALSSASVVITTLASPNLAAEKGHTLIVPVHVSRIDTPLTAFPTSIQHVVLTRDTEHVSTTIQLRLGFPARSPYLCFAHSPARE